MNRRKHKKHFTFTVLAGASAAAFVVLSVGGYLLHRKTMKRYLHELAEQRALNLSMYDDMYDENGFFKDFASDDDNFEDYGNESLNHHLNESNREGSGV
ncbi:MAG: hypothetical protein FWD90_06685 [Defluviitaleaceae bacterium]|nr:hypothetical protein [Defluviitaleaceae bacterium]